MEKPGQPHFILIKILFRTANNNLKILVGVPTKTYKQRLA